MPNWTTNTLQVSGPEEDLAKFISDVRSDGSEEPRYAQNKNFPDIEDKENHPTDLAFWKVVPVPKAILNAGYDPAGYNWEHENWGCKWGSTDVSSDKVSEELIIYTFSTAWVPPIKWLDKVAVKYPSLAFELDWQAEGGGSGCSSWNGEDELTAFAKDPNGEDELIGPCVQSSGRMTRLKKPSTKCKPKSLSPKELIESLAETVLAEEV